MKEILIFSILLLIPAILIGCLIGLITLSIGALIGNLTFYISEFIKKKIKNFKHHFDKTPTGIWYDYKGCKYYEDNGKCYSFTERYTTDNCFCSEAERKRVENEQEKM